MTNVHPVLQGVSDTPAWIVSQANTYARLTGKAPFVIYQGAWSIMERDFEREIIPMALAQGEKHPPSLQHALLMIDVDRHGPCSLERALLGQDT